MEFYPEKAVQDLEPASFFSKYKTNRISLQQAKDYEEVLVKRYVKLVGEVGVCSLFTRWRFES